MNGDRHWTQQLCWLKKKKKPVGEGGLQIFDNR
jgi:hypothetical protein